MQPQDRPEACPQCRSPQVVYIFYGLPSDLKALKPDLDAVRMGLGGCTVFEDSPQWCCAICGHEWGITEDALLMQEYRPKLEAAERAQDAAALARGILEARVNASGFAKCP